MKAISHSIFEKMLASAEKLMITDQWSQDEILVFKSDPIIKLLYGACAEEIGNVHEELMHLQQRLVLETIKKILPEDYQCHKPAHAIINARPLKKVKESKIDIDSKILIRNPEKKNKDFVFTPAGCFTLSEAEVKYLVFRDNIYILENGKNVPILKGKSNISFQNDVIWLGINDLDTFLPKDNLSIFFYLPQIEGDQYPFLNALKYCRCFFEEQPIKVTTGLSADDVDYYRKLITDPDFMISKMIQNTRDWYHKHYITLYDLPKRKSSGSHVPDELNKLFDESDLSQFKDDVCWIKLSFGNLLDEKWISKIHCSINSFPVLNLNLEKSEFNVESMPINIFPVFSDDCFLCMNSVTGKVNNRTEEIKYRLMEPDPTKTITHEGEAIFRKGGLGRQDPIKFKNILNLLSTILKEETIFLTKEGTREDLAKLNRLSRSLVDFESNLNIERYQKNNHEGNIILKPERVHSKIYIRFWTTSAEEANMIRPVSGFDSEEQCELIYGPEIKSDTIRLITNSSGGMKKPSDEEYLETVRKHILTRGRIVTAEDIKIFCYEHFNPFKVSVSVKKVVGISKSPQCGLVRSIEILIRFNDKNTLTEDELSSLKEDLLRKLERNSSNVMPFIISII